MKNLQGVVRIVFDQKAQRFYLIAERCHRHFRMRRSKNNECARIFLADRCGKFDSIHVRVQMDVEKINGIFGLIRKQIQQLIRRVDGLSNLHVVSLNENVLFNHGFEKLKLKCVILT